MIRSLFLSLMVIPLTLLSQFDQAVYQDASLADFEVFLELANKVKTHRSERLVSIDQFLKMSKENTTIILDTRSKEMYDAMHVKGAIHLNFADFNQLSLFEIIPDTNTRILIYCNNNFIEAPNLDDQRYFITKSYVPIVDGINEKLEVNPLKPLGITMALNIPTYINLYGYGYKNIYELRDLIVTQSGLIEFEGTAVSKLEEQKD